MKALAEKSSSKSDITRSPAWMKPPPILAKQHLTSFPGGNPFIQPKLKIGQPNDKYEQEADRVADRVMSMPETKQSSGKGGSGSPLIQRQTDECPECNEKEEEVQRQVESEEEEPEKEEEEEEPVQAKHVSNRSPPMTTGLQCRIQSRRDGGVPLSRSTRSFFEPRFGRDFGSVRVHTGAKAAEAAKAVHAKAFTFGRDIVFGAGQYSTNTIYGKRLLAHELVHVTQQRPAVMRSETPVPAVPTAPVETCTTPPDWKRVRAITRANMKRRIDKSGILDPKATRTKRDLILKTDTAIRDEFGSYIPNDRKFGRKKSVTIRTVDQLKQEMGAGGAANAVKQAATEVLENQKELSPDLCLPEAPAVISNVVNPILNEPASGNKPSGTELAKDYAVAIMPAKTNPIGKEAKTSVVERFAFMGHILVHEAMHFYTHPNFEKAAKCADLQDTLMEGAAELFARQVIRNNLNADDRFKINTGTRLSELNYVRDNFSSAGLPAAFFLGNTGSIGLNPDGPCKQIGARNPRKGSPIDVDVLGLETKTGKDANIARAAAVQEGIDIVVESIEDMIKKLDNKAKGGKCIRRLSIFNHGSPGAQMVSSSGEGEEQQKSGFYLKWLKDAENKEKIGTLRSVFCADGFMRWLGCATAGVLARRGTGTRTAEELKSQRYRGHKYVKRFYQSDEDVDVHQARTQIRGLEVLQQWANEVGVPIIAANDLTRMNEKGIVVRYGGSWFTVYPSTSNSE